MACSTDAYVIEWAVQTALADGGQGPGKWETAYTCKSQDEALAYARALTRRGLPWWCSRIVPVSRECRPLDIAAAPA